MIEIAKVGDLPPVSEWDPWMAYVGRENRRRGLKASPLANPFVYGKRTDGLTQTEVGAVNWSSRYCVNREDAVAMFEKNWLDPMLHMGEKAILRAGLPNVVAELDRLRALLKEHGRLVLVGGPHAEVIKEVLESAERSA